jgi:hypothetical protein
MGISPTGVVQKAKKAYINHPRSQSPDPDALAKYFMCLDGAGEARRSNKRRRIR